MPVSPTATETPLQPWTRAWLRSSAPAGAGAVAALGLQVGVHGGVEVGGALVAASALAVAALDLGVRSAGVTRRAPAGHPAIALALLALGLAAAALHPLPRWPGPLLVVAAVVAAALEWPAGPWVERAPARRARRLRLMRGMRLAALAAVGLGLAVSAEVYLRASGRYVTWTEANGGRYVSPFAPPGHDVTWTSTFAPGGPVKQAQPEFSFDDVANGDGLRDVDHPAGRAPGEVRVVGLGDSFMMGQGAPIDATFLRHLARGAQERLGRPVRPVVGGLAGSDVVFQYQLLRTRLARHRPELVVVLVNASDLTDLKSRGGLDRFDADGHLRPLAAPWFEPLFERSRLVRALLLSGLGHDWTLASPAEQRVQGRAAAAGIADAIDAIEALARTWGGATLVVVHPGAHELRDLSGRPAEIDLVREELATRGRPFVDLVAQLRQRLRPDDVARWFWPIDGHCRAEGYGLFAELVLADPIGQAALERLKAR